MHAYFETTLGGCIRYSFKQRPSSNNSKILAVPLFYYSNRYLSSKTFSLPMHSRASSCLSQQEKCKIYAFKVNNKYTKMKGLFKTLTIFTKSSIIDLEISQQEYSFTKKNINKKLNIIILRSKRLKFSVSPSRSHFQRKFSSVSFRSQFYPVNIIIHHRCLSGF